MAHSESRTTALFRVCCWGLTATLCAIGATCGGTVDASKCESSVGPFEVPGGPGTSIYTTSAPPVPSFRASFGTAEVFPNSDPIKGNTSVLWVLLTPEANACPLDWTLNGSRAPRDELVLLVAVEVLAGQSFLGSHSGISTNAMVASGFVASGQPVWTSLQSPVSQATQSVTIIKFVEGSEVAGSFMAQFGGGAVSGTFDVPFCTAACGSEVIPLEQ